MPKAFTQWTVLPHEPPVQLADNLRWVRGTLPGFSLRRVMTVVRLADGRLVIHNAISLNDAAQQELEAWGEPAFLIVPNGGHRLDAAAYKARYPALRVFAPRGSQARVAEVVAVDGSYEDFPEQPEVRLETLQGVAEAEGAMLVRSGDGTSVVLNDVMFNMDAKRDPMGWLITTLFRSAPGPRVSLLSKWLLIKNRAELRAEFERFSAIPDLVRVIVAHEKVASGADAKAAILRAAEFL